MMQMQFHEKKYRKPPNPIFKSPANTASTTTADAGIRLSLVLAAPSPGCGSCGRTS